MRSRSTPINLKILPAITQERSPLYRGAKAGALVLLGSATPSVESMYKAKHGDYTLYTLKKRYNEKDLPQAQIVDLKQEIRQGNATSISLPLEEKAARQYHRRPAVDPLSQPAGKQPVPCLRRMRRRSDVPEVQRAPDVSPVTQRLICHYCGYFRTGARALPKVRGRTQSRRKRDAED